MPPQPVTDKPEFVFEPLDRKHDRAAFSCGVSALDKYLQTQAAQDERKHLAATFVCTPDGKKIAGYYTLSQFSVALDDIPAEIAHKLTRQKQVPATLIGRLARDRSFAGVRIGELLLFDALYRSLSQSRVVASWAVILDAKDDSAAAFYAKYGFIVFSTISSRLFLPMQTIQKMFA